MLCYAVLCYAVLCYAVLCLAQVVGRCEEVGHLRQRLPVVEDVRDEHLRAGLAVSARAQSLRPDARSHRARTITVSARGRHRSHRGVLSSGWMRRQACMREASVSQ